jgi:hypothetical protein
MCIKAPKIPKPPPPPIPPSIREEGLVAQQAALRRKKGETTSPAGTVMTSPMGDPNIGRSVVQQALSAGPSVGVRI